MTGLVEPVASAPAATPRRKSRSRRASTIQLPAARFELGVVPVDRVETVAAECPVALVYNGVSHAVMMATPADLEEFGIGFSLAEGIVADASEILSVEVLDMALGLELRIEIPDARAAALDDRRRSMAGGTACGLCGIISIERAIRTLPHLPDGAPVKATAIFEALQRLPLEQVTNRTTGAAHAAAMATADGTILLTREDVGRHNALDKLVGAVARVGADPASGFLLLTSRCSTEMVQKAATAGFPILVAISAPTSLAVALAEEAGLCLVAFARGKGFTVYTRRDRIEAA
ncbi:MAG: formate dehydrogenase accessory sulfurtransferase FdhD [Geminicoccaceae bacterium]